MSGSAGDFCPSADALRGRCGPGCATWGHRRLPDPSGATHLAQTQLCCFLAVCPQTSYFAPPGVSALCLHKGDSVIANGCSDNSQQPEQLTTTRTHPHRSRCWNRKPGLRGPWGGASCPFQLLGAPGLLAGGCTPPASASWLHGRLPCPPQLPLPTSCTRRQHSGPPGSPEEQVSPRKALDLIASFATQVIVTLASYEVNSHSSGSKTWAHLVGATFSPLHLPGRAAEKI